VTLLDSSQVVAALAAIADLSTKALTPSTLGSKADTFQILAVVVVPLADSVLVVAMMVEVEQMPNQTLNLGLRFVVVAFEVAAQLERLASVHEVWIVQAISDHEILQVDLASYGIRQAIDVASVLVVRVDSVVAFYQLTCLFLTEATQYLRYQALCSLLFF